MHPSEPADRPPTRPLGAESLGFLVASVGQQVQAAFRLRLEPYEVHPRAYAVLAALVEDLDRSQHDLSRLLGLPASRMVGLVDALEEQGLVERLPHPSDGRAHLVRLTGSGRQKIAELSAEALAVEQELSAGLSEQERQLLRVLLLRIAANLGQGSENTSLRIW